VYPLDAKTKEGTPFWSLPKRPPTPLVFDPKEMLHLEFITAMACLRATIFRIKIPTTQPRTQEFRLKVGEMAAKIKVAEFVADDSAAKAIQASVQEQADKEAGEEKKNEEEKKEELKEEKEADKEQPVAQDDVEKLKGEFATLLKEIGKPPAGKTYEDVLIRAEEFEKDEDSNFHIDFMSSMGNCRAASYKLAPMDWIQVKLKAGRIVPAMATTTASIAGLQTLELVKLMKNAKKEDHRNIFLNLAVPIMQASEPGNVEKVKLTEKIETTLWDRWEVDGKNLSLKDIIAKVEAKYEGLEVRDVLRGNAPLFFYAVLNAPGREKEKERTLKSTLTELLEGDLEEAGKDGKQYVDLTITCVIKGGADEIVDGVPPLRVTLS